MEFSKPPGGGFLLTVGTLTRSSCLDCIAAACSFSALLRIASIFAEEGPAPITAALGLAISSPALYVVVFPVDRDFGTICRACTGRMRSAPVDWIFAFFGFNGSCSQDGVLLWSGRRFTGLEENCVLIMGRSGGSVASSPGSVSSSSVMSTTESEPFTTFSNLTSGDLTCCFSSTLMISAETYSTRSHRSKLCRPYGCRARIATPRFSASAQNRAQISSARRRVAAFPRTKRARFGLVRATFSLLQSERKPIIRRECAAASTSSMYSNSSVRSTGAASTP
mmetsp:Transcript_840/g.3265  ORF Transcript_840/g.3265 Transcript_840/m.3265 type:complete len:280 (+) Transcript_840:76-915(+)